MSKSVISSVVGKVQKAAKSIFGHTDPKSKPQQDRKLMNQLDEMSVAAFSTSRELHAVYQDGLNYAFGNQWANRQLKGGFEHVVANYIYPAMMQELAILSKRHSTITALGWDDTDKAGAKVWQGYFRHLYEREWKMKDWLLRAALDSKIYGHFVAYVTWEPRKNWDYEKNQWQGGPTLKLIPPEFFGCDPETDTVETAEYIVTRRKIPREKAKLIWPKHKEAIDKACKGDTARGWFMPDSLKLSSLNLENATEAKSTDSYALTSQRRLTQLITGARNQQRQENLKGPSRWVTVEQFLFKDWSLDTRKQQEKIPREELLEQGLIEEQGELGLDVLRETGEMLGDENHPTRSISREIPKYPSYRHVVRLGDTILNDKPADQVWPYRQQPFIVGVNQLLPHVWFGLNAVEMPRGMQDMTNMAMSHILDYIKSMSDPTWMKEESAMAKGASIEAGAGNVITVKDGKLDRIRRENPPNMSAGTTKAFEMAVRETQNQTGVHEVATGRQASGRATATEITMLQTNTQLRMALSNSILDSATIKIFETIGELAQLRLPPGELIRIVGDKHAATVAQMTDEMQFTRYDLSLSVTTSLPYDKEKRRQDAQELFKLVGMPALKILAEANEDIVEDIEGFMANVAAYQQLIALKEQAEAESAALQQQEADAQAAAQAPQ